MPQIPLRWRCSWLLMLLCCKGPREPYCHEGRETKRIKYSHWLNERKPATCRAGHLWPAAKFSIRASCETLLVVCVWFGVFCFVVISERATSKLYLWLSVSTKSKNTRKANSCKHDKLDCTYLMQPLFLVQTYFQMVGSSFDWHSFPQKQTKTIQKTLENEIREVEIFQF